MGSDGAARLLQGAELWERTGARATDPSATSGIRFLAGWEDGWPFCATVCTTDVGLAFCRRCPTDTVNRALQRRRAASGRCPAGVRLLAFPAPAGSADRVGVLRVGAPSARAAAAAAPDVRVAPPTLRAAARDTEPVDGRSALAAARVLRDPSASQAWQAEQRGRGADRRRAAAQTLAQMLTTSEELHQLYRESRRQRRQLDRSRRQVDRLARETLRAQGEERSRIAHEIHDTAAQSMVSAFRFLDAARSASAADGRGGEPDPRLVAASDRLQAAIGEVRQVLGRLLPPGLEELGLTAALRARLDVERKNGVEVEVAGDLPRLTPSVEQSLFGMASEAVSNAIRHGQAQRIAIDVAVARGRVVMTVADDGRGFDPGAVTRSDGGGLGLVGLARQASWLGGTARVTSRLGRGTLVRVSIPLARHAVPSEPQP